MPIQVTTTYTKDVLLRFNRFSAVRSPFQIVLYVLMELLMLAMGLMLIVTSESSVEFFLSVAVLTPLFLSAIPLVIWLMPMLTARMSRSLLGCCNRYLFFDEELEIHSDLPALRGESRVRYSYLDSVCETKDAFYLFLSKQQAFLVSKSEMPDETAARLREHLRKNMPPKKYVTKTKGSKLIPVLAVFILACVVFAAMYACQNPYSAYQEQVFSQSGLTLTLTDAFYETEHIAFTAAYESKDMAVFALKEDFSLFGSERPDLLEYAGMIIDYNQLDAVPQEREGLTYFPYRTLANGKEYQFLSTVHAGSDAYWLVQFACEADRYPDLEEAIIQYAKSVKVS